MVNIIKTRTLRKVIKASKKHKQLDTLSKKKNFSLMNNSQEIIRYTNHVACFRDNSVMT